MAKIYGTGDVALTVTFTVNEAEVRALDALVGYGDGAFITAFKEKLGAAYIEKHERGLRQFFTDIRATLPPILAQLDKARQVFKGAKS